MDTCTAVGMVDITGGSSHSSSKHMTRQHTTDTAAGIKGCGLQVHRQPTPPSPAPSPRHTQKMMTSALHHQCSTNPQPHLGAVTLPDLPHQQLPILSQRQQLITQHQQLADAARVAAIHASPAHPARRATARHSTSLRICVFQQPTAPAWPPCHLVNHGERFCCQADCSALAACKLRSAPTHEVLLFASWMMPPAAANVRSPLHASAVTARGSCSSNTPTPAAATRHERACHHQLQAQCTPHSLDCSVPAAARLEGCFLVSQLLRRHPPEAPP